MAIRTLPKELQQKVEEKMKEVQSRRNNDINDIKDWLLKQPHLHAENSDQAIVNFLRHAKFSLEKAKARIDNFYTFKTMVPELFENRDPFSPVLANILEQGIITVIMDNAKPLLPVVMVIRWGRVNLDVVSVLDVLKMELILIHIIMEMNDTLVINGLHLLVDTEGFTMKLLQQFTPAIIKKYTTCAQDVYPIKIHSYDDKNIVGKYEDLPESIIPEEYGGKGGSLDVHATDWKGKVESYRDFLVEDYKYRSDETKRPGRPKTAEELFGLQGSFRNLEVD